ncbi:CoA ester lyase [Methylocapsa sp. S129]|uniref:HpcH/HpaI aldolase/citrate lyase family protein n=1 Tax=Methylocapsa sp. S129 TaxID=1641869 RepID=UPI001575BCC9|nr:CoA ester lyase [Methylocapsa sp. S129]
MIARPRRSVLYMPGSNPRAIAKARSLAADVVILDLEDSVAPEAKAAAREQVAAAVREGGFGRREVVIRVNGFESPWGRDDLTAAAAAGPDAILLPKIDGPGSVMQVARELREAGAPERIRLWAMMETPMAVLHAGSIAAVAADPGSRLDVLVMGLNDLAKETRARFVPGRASMTAWLALCVVAAKAHGVDILDGVYNDIGDLKGFEAECLQGRDMGLDGKTLIHPGQVDIANAVFAPTSAEIDSAQAIIGAFNLPENAGKGAIQLDGKMVERLHAEIARRTLAIAQGIAALSAAAT